MFECFHCCTRSVIWDSDFTFEDFGFEGEGLVHVLHCTNCGAEIVYRIGITEDDIEELKKKSKEEHLENE